VIYSYDKSQRDALGFYYKNKYTQLKQLLFTCLKCSGNSSRKITLLKLQSNMCTFIKLW